MKEVAGLFKGAFSGRGRDAVISDVEEADY